MRLLKKFSDPLKAQKFSQLLYSHNIGNRVEREVNTDWGSDDYATQSATLWIVDEDQVDKAEELLENFEQNSTEETFAIKQEASTSPKDTQYPHLQAKNRNPKLLLNPIKKQDAKTGPITLYMIVLCSILFAFIDWQTPRMTKITEGLPLTPVLSTPLEKELLFDYPAAYFYIDKIVALYGPNKYESVRQLPLEGQTLYKKFESTPIWEGVYNYTLDWITQTQDHFPVGNLMEKIREGEIWRLITPCFLHGGIFHLIFNMFALMVLGKAMEARIGKWRYLLFTILTGVFSNLAQYLMSGANFIGYSGILCAMLGFIWMRQKVAAWEGYPFQPGAFSFTLFFVLVIAFVGVLNFFLQAAQMASLPINIANTAHLSGGLLGLFLGRLSFFECKFKD